MSMSFIGQIKLKWCTEFLRRIRKISNPIYYAVTRSTRVCVAPFNLCSNRKSKGVFCRACASFPAFSDLLTRRLVFHNLSDSNFTFLLLRKMEFFFFCRILFNKLFYLFVNVRGDSPSKGFSVVLFISSFDVHVSTLWFIDNDVTAVTGSFFFMKPSESRGEGKNQFFVGIDEFSTTKMRKRFFGSLLHHQHSDVLNNGICQRSNRPIYKFVTRTKDKGLRNKVMA